MDLVSSFPLTLGNSVASVRHTALHGRHLADLRRSELPWRRLGRRQRWPTHMAAASAAKSGGGNATSISSAQVDDMAGLASRAIMVPGVPDWVKLGVAKQAVNGIADAANSGLLPPELKDGLMSAMGGDGLLSEKLADKIVDVLADKIDIPLISQEQKKEVLKQVVQSMLVVREEDNMFLGAAQQSAKLAVTQGDSMIRAMAQLRTDKERTKLAEKLAADIDETDFMGKENEKQFMRVAVDALGEVVLNKVPPEALEAAINAGDESSVEEFLCTLVGEEIDVPFASKEQKKDMARGVIRGWLGTVDKEGLATEQQDAIRGRVENKAESQKVKKESGKSVAAGMDVAAQAAGFMGGFMGDMLKKNSDASDESTGSSASSSKKDVPQSKEKPKEKTKEKPKEKPKEKTKEGGGSGGRGFGGFGGFGGGGGGGGGGRSDKPPDENGEVWSDSHKGGRHWTLPVLFAWLMLSICSVFLRRREDRRAAFNAAFRTTKVLQRRVESLRFATQRKSKAGSGLMVLLVLGTVVVLVLLKWLLPATSNADANEHNHLLPESLYHHQKQEPKSWFLRPASVCVVAAIAAAITWFKDQQDHRRGQAESAAAGWSEFSTRDLSESAPPPQAYSAPPQYAPEIPSPRLQPEPQPTFASPAGVISMIRQDLPQWLRQCGWKSSENAAVAKATAAFALEWAQSGGIFDVALAICPYDRLHLVLTDLKAQRYSGSQCSIDQQLDWMRLKSLVMTPDGDFNAGLVLRSNGAAHAVIPYTPGGATMGGFERGTTPSLDPWESFAQRHGGLGDAKDGGGIMIVMAERLSVAGRVGATVVVHCSGSTMPWRSATVELQQSASCQSPTPARISPSGRLRLPAPPPPRERELPGERQQMPDRFTSYR